MSDLRMAPVCRLIRFLALTKQRWRSRHSIVTGLFIVFVTAASTFNSLVTTVDRGNQPGQSSNTAYTRSISDYGVYPAKRPSLRKSRVSENETFVTYLSRDHPLGEGQIKVKYTNQTVDGVDVLGIRQLHPHLRSQVSDGIRIPSIEKILSKKYVKNKSLSGDLSAYPDANLHNFRYIINNRSLCGGRQLRYVVYVHSAPRNYIKRVDLRNTWAQDNLFRKHPSKLVFFLGKSDDPYLRDLISAEAETYGDIVQEDFIDDYKNLTHKATGALKWLSKYCSNTDYVFKVDDDVYVNIFLLLDLLTRKYRRQRRLILCLFWRENSAEILRDPASCGKWCVDKNDFKGQTHYPQFCSGHAYFMTADIVPELYEASKTTRFFWIDDVYVTGLLAAKINTIRYVAANPLFSPSMDGLLAEELLNVTAAITALTSVTRTGEVRELWRKHVRRLPQKHINEMEIQQYSRLLQEAFSHER